MGSGFCKSLFSMKYVDYNISLDRILSIPPHTLDKGIPQSKKGVKYGLPPQFKDLNAFFASFVKFIRLFPIILSNRFHKMYFKTVSEWSITLHLRTITYSKILHRRGKVSTCSFTTLFPPPTLLDPSQEHPHTLMEEYQGVTVSRVMPASRVCFYVCIMYNHVNDEFYLMLVVHQVGEYVFP